MQVFMVGCRLSSGVMLGVALEWSLDSLYDSIGKNSKYSWHFHSVLKQQTMFGKFKNLSKNLMERNKIYRKK